MLHTLHLRRGVILLLAALITSTAHGADHYLSFGGGYAPSGNQVSLEKNMRYFTRVLEGLGRSDAPRTTFFADGPDDGRDLVVAYPPDTLPKVNRYLAAILGSTNGINEYYRTHKLDTPHQACSPDNLDAYFDQCADKLTADDRLMIYFTGHGGKGDKDAKHNTKLHLWDRKDITMTEFTQRLGKVPADVPVVMVMVQCFAGGFANVIFSEGDPDKGLADAPRCGFFATVHDRPAAGCTSDIDEADYQEYSSYFWAALLGTNRLGDKIDKPDYNNDGTVTFDEAHAYALLTSDSIDISIKTSDVFLRKFSRTEPGEDDNVDSASLFNPETSYGRLLAVAGASERAVLEGLSDQLKLSGQDRTKEARRLASRFEAEEKGLKSRIKILRKRLSNARKRLGVTLKKTWPELANPWHPEVATIMHTQTQRVLDVVEGHKDFDEFKKLSRQINELHEQARDLDHKAVKCKRFIYVAESVALAHNLSKVAEPNIVERFGRLRALEAGSMTDLSKR